MRQRKSRASRALGAAALLAVLTSLLPIEAQGLLDGGGASAAKGRVSWKVSIEPKEVKRGEKAEVVAEYTVEPGWWIYAPDHDAVPGQATVISVESPSVELAGNPAFPAPEVKRVEVLDETHRILKKTGVIRQPFVVKKDATSGDLAIKVASHFVACNEEMCDLPKKPSFDVTVKVLDTPSADAAPEKGAAPKARPEGRAAWKVTVEPREVRRGEKAEIVAEYTVEPGWWIYAPDHDAVPGQATVISVESPSVELAGNPAFPTPEVKRVEILNETHRILKKTGVIRQPFTVKNDAPAGDLAIEVTAVYVACNEQICDLQKKPAFEVVVRVSDVPAAAAAPAIEKPAKAAAPRAKQEGHASWKVSVEPRELKRGEKAEVVAEYTVQPGWWIYAPDHDAVPGQATEIRVESPGIEPAGKPTFPAPEVKRVPELNETHRILKKTGVIRQPFTVKKDAPTGDLAIKVTAAYVACDETMCDFQKTPSFEVAVKVSDAPAAAAVPEAERAPAPPAAAAADDPIASASFLAFILLMVGGGLLTLIMPCTYPMIPITISYFTKQADARHGAVTGLALAYGAGIILIFNVIGLVFAEAIGPIAFNPWVNLVFALAFVVFGLALLGVFELRLPSSMTTLASKATGTGGYLGVFLLGLVLVVTSFTCTAPILGALLRYAVEVRDPGRVALGMTAFGTTVAAPFVLLSLFPAKLRSLPRAGEWMHVVKVSLGFLELAAALKLLSQADLGWEAGALPRELFLVLWAALFVVLGLYLLGVFRLKDETAQGVSPIRMLFGLTSIFAAAYFFYGAMGYRLDWIMETMAPPYRAEAPAGGAAVRGTAEAGTKWTIVEDDFEAGIARALEEKKRAMINFTGHT